MRTVKSREPHLSILSLRCLNICNNLFSPSLFASLAKPLNERGAGWIIHIAHLDLNFELDELRE